MSGDLLDAIAPRVEASTHGAAIVGGSALQVHRPCRIEAGLRRGPLVTLDLIGRSLLLALAVTRIDEDVRCTTPITPRSSAGGVRLHAVGSGRRRVIGLRRRYIVR